MTDLDIAQYLGSSPNQHAIADLWMTFRTLFAGTAKGHGMQDRNIIANGGRFPDNQTGCITQGPGNPQIPE